jgi:hypothetical protein
LGPEAEPSFMMPFFDGRSPQNTNPGY